MKRLIPSLLAIVACHHEAQPAPPVVVERPPVAAREVVAQPAPAVESLPPLEATVVQIPVEHDSPTSVVKGLPTAETHIAFMPGLCSNAYAYMLGFPEAARAHGGVVAIEGDVPCPGAPGFHSFTWSPTLQRARIEKAFAAAALPIPATGLTLVGYSAGASIAEMMHEQWPQLFPKLVLIAPPSDPVAEKLRHAKGVVAMSCSLDVPYRMRAAAKALTNIHVPATYLEMPRCTHGLLADGEHTFDQAFGWLEGLTT